MTLRAWVFRAPTNGIAVRSPVRGRPAYPAAFIRTLRQMQRQARGRCVNLWPTDRRPKWWDEKTDTHVQDWPAGLPSFRRSSSRKAHRTLYGGRHCPAAKWHRAVSNQKLNPRTAGTPKRAEADSSASEEKLGLNKGPEPLGGRAISDVIFTVTSHPTIMPVGKVRKPMGSCTMRSPLGIFLAASLLTATWMSWADAAGPCPSTTSCLPARGAPGPIVGAGLPVLAIGFGVYWLVKRRRKAN